MLSRFALCGGSGLNKCLMKFQPASAITTSAVVSSTPPLEYPPAGSKRDHVNFPRLTMREVPPPVRLGFLPDSWFKAFYPKTGYTGPYMFLISLLTYSYSKEIIVQDHNLIHLYGFICLCWFIPYKFGDKIAAIYNKLLQDEIDYMDGSQNEEKQLLRDSIKYLEDKKTMKDAIAEIGKAKTEIVHLQMEASYRERVLEAYKQVKNKLDCQVELDNVERRIAQKNIVDFVMTNVMKSITPDLEKNVLQTCISDLNALAARA